MKEIVIASIEYIVAIVLAILIVSYLRGGTKDLLASLAIAGTLMIY